MGVRQRHMIANHRSMNEIIDVEDHLDPGNLDNFIQSGPRLKSSPA
jgi:hypothetical protein